MFVYLSKKIAIPSGVRLRSTSWNSEQGWIACGGENGLLKVLKLDKPRRGDSKGASNLSMNQTLEGHQGPVQVITWNAQYRKLTTSDANGLIIVWMLHKGLWFEEMINNRNKSVVRAMRWTADGQKICIVYEDGAVIVGSVDGNRLWGKELDMELANVAWSPDGRNILFCSTPKEGSELFVYSGIGEYVSKIPLFALDADARSQGGEPIIGVDWYAGGEGYLDPSAPTLAVAFQNGRVQIMRHDQDEEPVLIDTGMTASHMCWSTDGQVLAISGTKTLRSSQSDQTKEQQCVQFYGPWGNHFRTLKVPGSGINAVSWEGGSLRLALAVDSFIYFANIRKDYKWGFFGDTLVYAFTKPERTENCVVFWDTSIKTKQIKYVRRLMAIRAADQHCVLATRTDDQSGQFILILCNSIGSPVDSKYIDVEPKFITMTPTHIVCADESRVFMWQYKTGATQLNASRSAAVADFAGRDSKEKQFHIDSPPNGGGQVNGATRARGTNPNAPTADPICAITASKNVLLVARASGTIARFSLPHLSLDARYAIRYRAHSIALNCDATRLSLIDINGVFTLLDIGDDAPKPSDQPKFERKDAWDMIWSDDNPDLFAVMEKARMYVFRGRAPEEPVMSNAHLCQFNDLCIKTCNLDEVMLDAERPDKSALVAFETKSLRDTRSLLDTCPLSEALQFVEDNPHPRLWRLLAESALEQLSFAVVDRAFVKCSDYQGIQLVKRLKLIQDRQKQKAEVAAYFRRFDEAESIYLKTDSKDLALDLRTRLGDWLRVVQLIQAGAGNDKLLATAFNNIGDYYKDRHKWDKAFKYFTKAKSMSSLAECAYMLEDFISLEKLVAQIPEADGKLLSSVGDKFMSVGLATEAVAAYLRGGDVKGAVDCCVLLNQWDQAVELAEQHNFPQIDALLSKYATHLLSKGGHHQFQAVELYKKAAKAPEAAKLLMDLGREAGATKVRPLRAKQLYVLAALELDKFKKKLMELDSAALTQGGTTVAGKTGANAGTNATLNAMLAHDTATMTMAASSTGGLKASSMDNAWHGAEAFHFLVLCTRQLMSGQFPAAVITAVRLTDYDDILSPREVYSLLALAAFETKKYGLCSRAFIKLESLDDATDKERQAYKQLALSIFIRYPPRDPDCDSFECNKCGNDCPEWSKECSECSTKFPGCIVTGRPVYRNHQPISAVEEGTNRCHNCGHLGFVRELSNFSYCPLCHSLIKLD